MVHVFEPPFHANSPLPGEVNSLVPPERCREAWLGSTCEARTSERFRFAWNGSGRRFRGLPVEQFVELLFVAGGSRDALAARSECSLCKAKGCSCQNSDIYIYIYIYLLSDGEWQAQSTHGRSRPCCGWRRAWATRVLPRKRRMRSEPSRSTSHQDRHDSGDPPFLRSHPKFPGVLANHNHRIRSDERHGVA